MLHMTLSTRFNPLTPLAMLVLVAGLGCRDAVQPVLKHPALSPNAEISDGAHGIDRNDDVFFLPPMVSNPTGSPGYGDPFQPGLPVTIRICVKSTTGCSLFTSFGPGQVQTSSDHYQANWDTKSPNADPAATYRIEVYVGSTPENHLGSNIPKPVSFADVDVVSSGSQLKNVNTGDFIPLLDGRTLPINVRIERGWNCKNNSSCVSQVVSNDLTAPVTVQTNDGMNAAQFSGHWHDGNFPVIVSIEDITAEANKGAGCTLGLPNVVITTNHCVRYTADPDVVFTNTVTVNTCLPTPADNRQLLLKYDVDEAPTFLRDAPPPIQCPVGFASTDKSSNPLVRLASSALSKLAGLFMPNTAYAIDLGVGGSIDSGGGFSVFALGFPANMDKIAGDGQTAVVGLPVAVAPQVKLYSAHVHELPSEGNPHPEAVVGAQVICTPSAGGLVGGNTSATVTTNAAGIATCPSWVLAEGNNTLVVSAVGYNQSVAVEALEPEGEASTLHGSVTFAATGLAAPSLISCNSDAFGGGVSLNTAQLRFSADTPGEYSFSLTARSGTYDGTVIGVANAKVNVSGGRGSFSPATFAFPAPVPSVTAGSIVTFALAQLSGPSTEAVFYQVPSNGDESCAVTQTNGTTPPLDTFRRNGVNVQIHGAAQPAVIE
jgi:hypothetical protein